MIQKADGNGQVFELDLGMELIARLPSQEVVQTWRANKKLVEFQAYFGARIGGLLRVIPNPQDLKNKKKWLEIDGDKVFVLDFNGRKHDIKGTARGEFLEQCKRLGLSLPIPAEARDIFWKPGKKKENVTPLFPFPMDSHLERRMQTVREELQWYLENMVSTEGGQQEDQEEVPSAPEVTPPHKNGKMPTPVVSAPPPPTEPAAPTEVPPVAPPQENPLEKELADLRSLQVREEQALTEARQELEKLPQESMEHGQEMARKESEIETLIQGLKGLSKNSKRPLEEKVEQARTRIRELRGIVAKNDRRCRELPKIILRLESSTSERAAEIERLETEFLEALEAPTTPVSSAPAVDKTPPPTEASTPKLSASSALEPAPPAMETRLPLSPPNLESLKTEDIEALVMSYVGERAKGIISAAELQAARTIAAAKQEAADIIASARQESEALLSGASDKLRAALGILSQPHANPPRDSAEKQK